MKKYAKVNQDGMLLYSISSNTPEDGFVELDFDIGTAPGPGYLYNFNTKAWVQKSLGERELEAWNMVKASRNRLLEAYDWTQLPDVPLTTKAAWATYRQQLRDITTQSDPFNITWPVPPNA